MHEMIETQSHPLLDAIAFITEFPRPLGELAVPPEISECMRYGSDHMPLQTNEQIKKAVRDLLRQGGFKPTGRSKPASEYLLKAVRDDQLQSINLAVDILNVVSLHSGLPISVVDLDKLSRPLTIRIAPSGDSYVFNASGQTMDIGGLICLYDQVGPCANAVKDSQRTKTSEQTVNTLSMIWGTVELPGRTRAVYDWYGQLLKRHNAAVHVITRATQ